ncbi:class D sortase [Ureibacillus sp. 179-F W5.1 NHS]|uniref:class D sortase n=1 Tax=unclassified Ureibacillus TaxID=2638520 RepID=UPI0031192C42
MIRIISWILVIAGCGFLLYEGYQLYTSSSMESKRLDEAKAMISDDSHTSQKESSNKREKQFQEGNTLGIFYIPRLDREIPIIEGTDEDELAQGVGHFSSTGLPGDNRQILLSGHRDTVFRQFGELKVGDELHIKMEYGTFIYVIEDYEIVDANDRTVIQPSREEEYLTVSTCYPFSFIGGAPDRYILYAYPKKVE